MAFFNRYVVVENLRYFLSAFKTSEPFWFGHKYKTNVTAGFFSGGAGNLVFFSQGLLSFSFFMNE